MKITGWIIVQAKKDYNFWSGKIAKLTKSKPASVPKNAIAIKLEIELPDSLFEQTQFQAKITVSEDQTKGVVINAETQENISEILTDQLGVNVHISSELLDS